MQGIENMKDDARMEGRMEGQRDAHLASIRNLMKKKCWSAQEEMDTLMLPAEEQKQYSAFI